MSDEDPAFERGTKRRREVLGDAWVDRALANRTPFNSEQQSLMTRFGCGLPAANMAFHRAEALLSSRSGGTTL